MLSLLARLLTPPLVPLTEAPAGIRAEMYLGTSGMKAAINGAINLSVADGWWGWRGP